MRRTPLARVSPDNTTPRAYNSTFAPRSDGFPASRARGTSLAGNGTVTRLKPRPSASAFSPAVRRLIRGRAGNRCEWCALFLPSGAGQLQHRVARGMGGSSNPLLGSPVNAVLLCGTPATGDHGRCEARDTEMHAAGMWLQQYENPLVVPILLHGRTLKWLAEDGTYSSEPPVGAA